VLGAALCAPAQLLHAPGELVAQRLELLQPQQARPADRTRNHRGADVREAFRDDRRELALEALDLRAQRPARGVLGLLPGGCAAGREGQTALDG